MNHNNLCKFINIKILNLKQTKWAVKLAVFDFVILYKLGKINSADASLRCLDYIKIINKSIDRFLSIL